ncbi:MAG: 16S rRNA (uracil(1498)-N(3))-methyltransferase [Candidatus Omnitrophica bacterium]|nr:16S rRNA (uracil(1498)-N(3))-methyltransferase [Candidatus Omnitrophota bacterium]
MPRILISPTDLSDSLITLHDRDTLHHLTHVLRVKAGASVECFDGQGTVYAGTVVSRGQAMVTIQVERQWRETSDAAAVVLLPALIRPERFDWMVEKATELGVSAVRPIITARTTVRAAGPGRIARWRRIAQSAAAQCGRATVPAIEAPKRFKEAASSLQGASACLPTLAERGLPLSAFLAGCRPQMPLAIFIGPEGDFSPEEIALATTHGITPVSLGRLTLRAETAAVAALSLVQARPEGAA